jgi:hypothetical protein
LFVARVGAGVEKVGLLFLFDQSRKIRFFLMTCFLLTLNSPTGGGKFFFVVCNRQCSADTDAQVPERSLVFSVI